MLRRGEALPRWAREYGSGNSGEGEERSSVGWQERVEEMAEKEAVERRLQARRAAEEVWREVMGRLCQGGWGVRGRSVGGRRTERQGRGRRMGKGRRGGARWCEGLRRAEIGGRGAG